MLPEIIEYSLKGFEKNEDGKILISKEDLLAIASEVSFLSELDEEMKSDCYKHMKGTKEGVESSFYLFKKHLAK